MQSTEAIFGSLIDNKKKKKKTLSKGATTQSFKQKT